MRRSLILLGVALACVLALAPAAAVALPDLPSSAFTPSSGCGCHAGLLDDWRPSMHYQALSDPIYQLKLKEGDEATDGALGPFCNACHGPVAVMSDEIAGLDQSKLSSASADAIGCDFCHQVSGTNTPLGNTSQQVTADGTERAQLKDAQAPHAVAYSAFHETAEFCGACHNVDHPGNGLHLEATYSEWKAGPYAAEGVVCQDCHMTPGPGVTEPNPGKAASSGPDREHVFRMTFAGGNVALGDAARAEERLQAAATLALDVPEIVESGEVAVRTTITNVGAGHLLPTGLTEVRQMWLEVVATDGDGSELLRQRRDFGTVLANDKGEGPVELWEAASIKSDDRIAPRQSTSNDYAFAMGDGPVTVEATLYYRSCSEEMAEKAGVDVPTTVMVSAKKAVYASDEQLTDSTAEAWSGEGSGSGLLGLAIIGLIVSATAVASVFIWRRA